MLSDDIENLKLQLIRIYNEQRGLYLTKANSSVVINSLDSFQERVEELEKLVRPHAVSDLELMAGIPTYEAENVVSIFSKKHNNNKGDVA